MKHTESAQLAELIGGAMDGERIVVDPGSNVIRIPRYSGEVMYRRTGDQRVESAGGVTVHFFTIEP